MSNPTTSFPIYFSNPASVQFLFIRPVVVDVCSRRSIQCHNQHVTSVRIVPVLDSISSWSVNYWQYPETLILISFPWQDLTNQLQKFIASLFHGFSALVDSKSISFENNYGTLFLYFLSRMCLLSLCSNDQLGGRKGARAEQ